MSSRTPALRGSLLAVCASLALASFAAEAEEKSSAANEALDTLPTTVVTASRFQEAASIQTQGVSVITAQDIAQSGSRSVTDALTRVLGLPLKLDTAGGGNSSIDLRGYGSTAWSNQVLIIDGVRMNEGDMATPQINSLPIDSIERIEVVRGAASVLYGEGASAGAIIISTKAGLGIARKTGGSVKVGLGNQKQRELAANATFAAGNGFSLDASVQKSLADNHRKNFDADDLKSRIGAQWSNDWLRVGGYIGSSKEKGGLPGSLSAAAYAQDPSQAGGYTQRFMLRHEDHGLFAQAQLGAWELAADSKWRTKAFRSTDNFAGFSDSDVKSKNFSLRAKHQIKTDSYTNALTLGFDHSKTDADRRSTWVSAKPTAKNAAWYIKDDISFPSNGTQLSAGLRTEKVNRVSGVQALHQRLHAWDLGVTQAITPQWSAFARLAKAFRVANVDELPPFGAAGILEPQTSRDLEAGLRWNTAEHKLELRAYRSRLEHEIALNDGGIGGFTNINFDPTKRSGIELDGSTAISKTVQLSAHLGLRHAQFRSGAYAGKRVPLVPKQTLSLGADWQALPGHDLMARANFVGKQAVLVSNGCQVPGFATLDVGYRYTVGSWELNTQVQNLGDKRYYNWAFGCANPNTPTGIYPESGRRINATLSYQF